MTPRPTPADINDHLGELATTMRIRFTSTDPQHLTATMPVRGNRQPLGLLHGGASAVMAETLGSVAAALLAPTGRVPMGIELSCSHHRAAVRGSVHGVATPLAVGRSLATVQIRLHDDAERPTCTARLTCLYREPLPGAAGPHRPDATESTR